MRNRARARVLVRASVRTQMGMAMITAKHPRMMKTSHGMSYFFFQPSSGHGPYVFSNSGPWESSYSRYISHDRAYHKMAAQSASQTDNTSDAIAAACPKRKKNHRTCTDVCVAADSICSAAICSTRMSAHVYRNRSNSDQTFLHCSQKCCIPKM